ncbi:MAG: hypothetical protein MJK08_00855 [Campylobacterales bacterium]|nr:hypothetical protein [Campylobacterales bacterium]NQY53477.1 hypothetical protein [Campylobacteraceae bacterium]
MKDIFDIIIIIMFVIIVFGFVRGFNKHQIDKHVDKLEENKKREEND